MHARPHLGEERLPFIDHEYGRIPGCPGLMVDDCQAGAGQHGGSHIQSMGAAHISPTTSSL